MHLIGNKKPIVFSWKKSLLIKKTVITGNLVYLLYALTKSLAEMLGSHFAMKNFLLIKSLTILNIFSSFISSKKKVDFLEYALN